MKIRLFNFFGDARWYNDDKDIDGFEIIAAIAIFAVVVLISCAVS